MTLMKFETIPNGSIVNALVRCFRKDHEAEGLFEHVRPDLGLWVLELDYTYGGSQAEQIAEICQHLHLHEARLKRLYKGSSDYALHLAFHQHEYGAITLPRKLSRLAAECGFYIEIYSGNEDA